MRLLFRFDDKGNALTKAAGKILAAAEYTSSEQKQGLLTDWFAWMDIEKWETKWKTQFRNVDSRMAQHNQWVENAMITHTPTFFVNGRRLTGRYNLDILEKLIPSLMEDKDMIMVSPEKQSYAHD